MNRHAEMPAKAGAKKTTLIVTTKATATSMPIAKTAGARIGADHEILRDRRAIEEARLAFAKASGDEELKRIATDIQRMVMDDGVIVPLGEFRVVTAMRSSISGFMKSPVPVFWNVEKK